MDPVSVDTVISRPPREVFNYLQDVANHPQFLADIFEDWRVTREDTVGRGAGVRFHLKQRFNRFGWMDQTLHQLAVSLSGEVDFAPACPVVAASPPS